MAFKLFTASVLCLLLAACAIPPASREEQHFIPDSELYTVQLVREALFLQSRSRYFEAETKLRQAVLISPGEDNIKIDLAVVLTRSEQYAEAEEIFQKLRQNAPDDTRLLTGLAQIYQAKNDYPQARRLYEAAFEQAYTLEDWPKAAGFAHSLSALAFRAGDESTGLCYAESAAALSRDPMEVPRYGQFLVALNLFSKVLRELSAAAEQRGPGQNAGVLHAVALAHYGMGHTEQAVKLEDLAMDRISTAPGIRASVNLVRFVASGFKTEETEEGEEEKEAAAQQDPVEALYRTGRLDTAQTLYWPVNLTEAVEKYAQEKGFATPDGKPRRSGFLGLF